MTNELHTESVVIFAGGLGTRLREETEYKPKPMVEIGSHPILWHIMKIYSTYGFKNFIICAGYKKNVILDYFLNFHFRNNDIEIDLTSDKSIRILNNNLETDWNIKVIDTGLETNTGGRLKQIEHLIESEHFLCTYGDGLADVNILDLFNFHKENKKIATLTAVKPPSRFGILEIDSSGLIKQFSEKPPGDNWVNGGFFVFDKEIFNFLEENSVLEQEPLHNLASIKQLMAYQHSGFWQPMDTYREFQILNQLWTSNQAPWKNWS